MTLFPARAPLESVALDLLGPLPKSRKGHLYILVIVNRFSKLCRFLAMRSTTAEKVAKAFRNEWVFVYGPAKTLLTDNGPQLTAKLFLETCRVLGSVTSSPRRTTRRRTVRRSLSTGLYSQ